MNHLIKRMVYIIPLSVIMSSSNAESIKRYSISVGWLHVMPQGSTHPLQVNTPVYMGMPSTVGLISTKSFLASIDPKALNPSPVFKELGLEPTLRKSELEKLFELTPSGITPAKAFGVVDTDNNGNVLANTSGTATLYGLENWTNPGTGLEPQKVDTLGLILSYYLNDQVSLQLIGGLPPKVDIKGKGKVVAPMSGVAVTNNTNEFIVSGIGGDIPLRQDIPITNLGNKPKVSTARAWTPALEVQYQFGKSGVDKFRPYVGAGIMYAHFSNIKVNSDTRKDLVAAGHMVQNILDGKAGAALDRKVSSATPNVKVKADDAIAPIVTLGLTYDFNENWYGVASLSYAKLNNQVKIDVINSNNGKRLIRSTTKIEVDPLITYLGVGYRF